VIDAELRECRARKRAVDGAARAHQVFEATQHERAVGSRVRGDVTHSAQEAVRDARRTARGSRDRCRAIHVDRDAELASRSQDDRLHLGQRVRAQLPDEAEAIEQRLGQFARVGRRAEQGERRQGNTDHALAGRQVDDPVFHGRVQALGDGAIERVDLIDEEDVAVLQRGEQGRERALVLDGGCRCRTELAAQLGGDDGREARLAEPCGTREELVIELPPAALGGTHCATEVRDHLGLADVVVERLRAQSRILHVLRGPGGGRRGGGNEAKCGGGGHGSLSLRPACRSKRTASPRSLSVGSQVPVLRGAHTWCAESGCRDTQPVVIPLASRNPR